MLTPNTAKREINLQNKIVIQNNNNINVDEINGNNLQEKFKKPTINLDIIENNDNNSTYPNFPFFSENMGGSVANKIVTTPANFFNLSPTSPFIPKNIGDKNL